MTLSGRIVCKCGPYRDILLFTHHSVTQNARSRAQETGKSQRFGRRFFACTFVHDNSSLTPLCSTVPQTAEGRPNVVVIYDWHPQLLGIESGELIVCTPTGAQGYSTPQSDKTPYWYGRASGPVGHVFCTHQHLVSQSSLFRDCH